MKRNHEKMPEEFLVKGDLKPGSPASKTSAKEWRALTTGYRRLPFFPSHTWGELQMLESTSQKVKKRMRVKQS